MERNTRILPLAAALLVACGPSGGQQDVPGYESPEAEAEAELAPETGEESSVQLAKDQTYEQERAGSLLMLAYDEETNSFTGTVENVSQGPLSRVRVEVHLSNGVELGPTTPADLAPGESRPVSLQAPDEPFETWSAHAEVGDAEGSEHEGEGGEHEGEHREEESGDGKESR